MSQESESHIEHIDPAERYKRKKQIEKDLSTLDKNIENKILTCTECYDRVLKIKEKECYGKDI